MNERLSDDQWAAARAALNGGDSQDLLDLVFDLHFGRPTDGASNAAWRLARELEWVSPSTRKLTVLGELVADPVREYRLWIERGRTAHREHEHPPLAAAQYAGKAVLEPGSGFGCNLFSLSRMPGRFVGLEPIDIYRQFTPIFAEREGIPCPEIVAGRCEELPFADREFDVVLCYSAHQYMDIDVALAEMARVLRPGGQVRIVGETMSWFLRNTRARWAAGGGLRRLARDSLTVLNTVAYGIAGKRLVVPGNGTWATSAPIYPSLRFLSGRMRRVGLDLRKDLSGDFSDGTCLVAEKIS